MVLTEQKDTAHYMATMEAAYRAKEEQLFENIEQSNYATSLVPGGYPTDPNGTNPNDSLIRVNGSDNKTGPSLVLKVMSGDVVDIGVKSFYRPTGSAGSNSNPVNDILNALATGIVGIAGEAKGTLSELNNTSTSPLLGALNSFLSANNPNTSGKPKAYLNWILLDEQFNFTEVSSGAIVVGDADELETLANSGIPITKNGFLYIYVSNETQNWNVFFDNLAVMHYTGPVVEETHYYPFGLTMAGISSRALKPNLAENKYKFNGIEFNDDLDIDQYDAFYRNYNPQIGRWFQVDPKPNEGENPYAAMGNNPILYSDFLGDTLTPAQKAYFLVPEKSKDGDQKGFFRNSTEDEKENRPVYAFFIDFSHLAIAVTGLNEVDDFVADRVDGKNSPGEITAGIINVGLNTGRGKKGKTSGNGKVEIIIDANLHPEAAKHANDAMSNGVSGEGVVDRPGSSDRRKANLKNVEIIKKKDRDEFPPRSY